MFRFFQHIWRFARCWILTITPYRLLNPYQKFLRDGGDDLLVLDFDLNSESTVVDFGGYLGDWSSLISAVYNPNLYIIEPVEAFCAHLQTRFASSKKVHILPFAVGESYSVSEIAIAGDATSLFGKGDLVGISLKPFEVLIDEITDTKIDLASINIEGGEYELLELLIREGYITMFRTLLIQFHDVNEQSAIKRADIEKRLLHSHDLIFDYPMIWQRYNLK